MVQVPSQQTELCIRRANTVARSTVPDAITRRIDSHDDGFSTIRLDLLEELLRLVHTAVQVDLLEEYLLGVVASRSVDFFHAYR